MINKASSTKQQKVVIIGGGFAGLTLARKLSKDLNFHITIVDKNNYHFFPPLLYQVASSFIEPSSISYPFRRWMQNKKNLRFYLAEFIGIDPYKKIIKTNQGELAYDKAVLCIGTVTHFFGMENIAREAFPMKTIQESLGLRNHLLSCLEQASKEKDEEKRKAWTRVVIAGGGPTGVELAGMLAELSRNIGKKEYPEIPEFGEHIILADAGPVLLAPMSRKAQQEAEEVLRQLGVKVFLNHPVKDYQNHEVIFADGTTIKTHALVWASGVIGYDIEGLPKESIGRGKRIICDEYNKIVGLEDVYALGDACLQQHQNTFKNGHPQVAQVAIQQAQRLGENLIREKNGEMKTPFHYKDKGSMAIISKYRAVADLPGISLRGFPAWVLWLLIHIFPLVGFRNKIALAFNWFWAFITNDPTLRMMIKAKERK